MRPDVNLPPACPSTSTGPMGPLHPYLKCWRQKLVEIYGKPMTFSCGKEAASEIGLCRKCLNELKKET